MRKSGFTLIELMIVVAILSICLCSMFEPVRLFFSRLKYNYDEIARQERMTDAFQALRTVFRDSVRIDDVHPDLITVSGSRWSRISRFKDGGGITIESGVLVKLPFNFAGGLSMGPFQKIDSKTVWCKVQIDRSFFPMFWRCGK